MSDEVAITAVATPAPGKLERFKELLAQVIKRLEAEEPDTLQFEVYESAPAEDGGVKLALFERYASKAAMERHEQSPQYAAFFKTVMEEGLLQGPPDLFHGKFVNALRR